jgi:prepilin-type processing-associated H-X9-DG protein
MQERLKPKKSVSSTAAEAAWLPRAEALQSVNTASGPRDTTRGRTGEFVQYDHNGCMFMAYLTPNSTIPDQMASNSYCQYPFQNNAPCNGKSPALNAARSFHAGGVNALLADGSVKFFKNSISIATWRALSTTQGGEVISADSY